MKTVPIGVVCLLACLSSAWAMYSPSGPVTVLTESNFDSKLKRGVWLVEFYAPWCGHCKSLKPEWEKAAKGLEGIVNVGAVDADEHKALGGKYQVQGFPTIKFMYHDGTQIKAVEYKGGRTAKDIVTFGADKAKALALKRIGEKASSGGSSSGSGGGGGGGGGFYPASSKVVNLNSETFASEVVQGDDLWIVEFFAPWCGHCQKLKPEFISAAKDLDDKVKLGAVDCTAEESLCGEYGVRGYPTMKFFGRNKYDPQAYEGGRDAAAITAFGLEQWAQFAPPPEVRELTDADTFSMHCTGDEASDTPPKQLCFIAFLPDILDTKASGRNKFITILQDMAAAYKDRPYSYLWVQGGTHTALESNVEVGGYGYPALVALSPKRDVYVPHKGALEFSQVREWVSSIRTGGTKATMLRGELATVSTIKPWDGKDAEEIAEDEFSLDDIMGS